MPQLLDDHKFETKPKVPKPNKYVDLLGLLIFCALFGIQTTFVGTSETLLVKGSYFWMPFWVGGLMAFVVAPSALFYWGP